jgi:biopolymer transport protein ExbB
MMKPLIIIILISCFAWTYAMAETTTDMRQDYKAFEQQRQNLVARALEEKQAAEKAAVDQAQQIRTDKKTLEKAISDLKQNINHLKKENKTIEDQIITLKKQTDTLTQDLEATRTVNREFSGFVLGNARALKALLIQSLQSGVTPDRQTFLEPILRQQTFPSMEDITLLSDLLFKEIHASGQVKVTTGGIIDRQGREQQAKLLILGNFTGIYVLGNEVGFLLYSDQSQRFFALSKLPSARITDTITAYMAGRSNAVYIDISKGGAIRQLVHQLNLADQVPKGGAIVWPILGILVLAILILLERLLFFTRHRTPVDKLMNTLRKMILAGDWDGCKTYLEARRNKVIPKILLTALALKDRTRPEMENALQEAILGEIPAIERFLSTLGMLAAIAPLLGLLGTVTGMINTFHVITYYGTSDPRMMSGGISEALVTTMLGLSVAIPIMLAHTLLGRRVETQISKMEEKSVAFVNMVFKTSAQRY